MISNQILQSNIEGLKEITRIDLCVCDVEGKVLASTFEHAEEYESSILAFVDSPADSQVISGYQFFKVFDEHQLEYILLAKGGSDDVYMVGKLAAFQIQNLLVAYKERFDKDNFIKNMSDKKQVLYIRILVVVFIAISAILALIQYKSSVTFIAQLMGISWGALAGSFLAPFMFSLYSKKVSKASCWACFLFSSVLMLANIFFRAGFPAWLQSPINCGAFAMFAGMIIVPVVSLFTPKPDKELVDSAFACYEKETEVPQKTALGK